MRKLSFVLVCGVALVLFAPRPSWALTARVERYHGEPAIMVDGTPIPPMAVTLRDDAADYESVKPYLVRLGRAGIRLFYVYAKTRWMQPGDPSKGQCDGVTETVKYMKTVLDAVPDAYIILRLNVSPSVEWVNSHPEEMLTFNDGKPRRTLCTSVSFTQPTDGMHSLCSDLWREDGARAIKTFLDEVDVHPEASRIIGTFIIAGGTGEWYYPNIYNFPNIYYPGVYKSTGRLDTADGAYGDFSEPFRREFEGFLRRKYGSVDELRRVWRCPDATFERPTIPPLEERAHVSGAEDLFYADARDWSSHDIDRLGFSTDLNDPRVTHLGVFLNAATHQNVSDFYDAWHESTARTVIHFARVLKRLRPNRIVGAFYGAYGSQDYFASSTVTGVRTVLDCEAVDFLAAPGVYNNREPGGTVAQREMQDSFRLRNKIYVCEEDSRTHLTKTWFERTFSSLYTLQDSVDVLKRDFARNVCEGTHAWWFDMGLGSESPGAHYWYDDPGILGLFAQQQKIAKFAYSLDCTKRNEIALVYDCESVHYVSHRLNALVLDHYRSSDLARIGAPVDYYLHNDLADPRMPDYKVYVMLHQYCLTDAEREAVYAKARKNGAVVLWLYAPGFVCPGTDDPMSADNISRTVGMKIRITDKTFAPRFRVDPASHPILAGASPSRQYGVLDRLVHSNVWDGDPVRYPFVNPGFYIEDARATPLGRYCHNGCVAFAMVETNGVRSVYCAAPIVRSDLLASIAAYAGCHIYSERDDVLYANENFVAVHADGDGRRTIRFKRKCSPYEVYERKYYGRDVDRIDVDMRHGQTLMWNLSGKIE